MFQSKTNVKDCKKSKFILKSYYHIGNFIVKLHFEFMTELTQIAQSLKESTAISGDGSRNSNKLSFTLFSINTMCSFISLHAVSMANYIL